jgi:hypothetical protein
MGRTKLMLCCGSRAAASSEACTTTRILRLFSATGIAATRRAVQTAWNRAAPTAQLCTVLTHTHTWRLFSSTRAHQHSTAHSRGREAARTAALGQRRCIYISLVIYSVALKCACSLSLTICTLHRTQEQPSQHVCNWCIVHTHTHSPSHGTLPTAPISHSFDTHVIHMTHKEK